MNEYLILDSKLTFVADEKMNNETVKKLWNSFWELTGKIFFPAEN